MRVIAAIAGVCVCLFAGFWFGLEPLVRQQAAASVDAPAGRLALPGLRATVTVRRDALGVPLVEAQNLPDLAFATGYVMAQDRLAQMVGMSLTAQGRLSEMTGSVAFPLDLYMRTLGVRHVAEAHLRQVPPSLHANLQRFADGVNAYVDTHRDRLPFALASAGYQPEPWTPANSMDIYVLLNLGLSLNLHQELAFLAMAGRVGPERAAWLLPTMPDEPLPLEEARKFAGLNIAGLDTRADRLAGLNGQLANWLPTGMAASNNWVIAPSRTAKGASILANDTHLLLQHPPLWMQMQMRAPGYQAVGIAVAGIPGIVAGYNGHIAWGMTMVMADGQDLFVEKVRRFRNGKVMYQTADGWQPVRFRRETFRIRGRDKPIHLAVRNTHHGVLIDDALQGPAVHALQPEPVPVQAEAGTGRDEYRLALAWTVREPDASLSAMWELAKARSVAEAQAAVRDLRYIHLNVVLADRENIAWQVTGRYPVRKAGTGKFPSPGWTGQYDWQGWAHPKDHPGLTNPEAGYFGTGNDRKVSPGSALHLSSSWFYPERGERIDELLSARSDHTRETAIAMQADQVNRFAGKLRTVLLTDPLAAELTAAIGKLPERDRLRAMEAHMLLAGWNGDMRADSKAAAVFGLFQGEFPRQAFLDELGPDDTSPAFRALVRDHHLAYSATQDHLLQRAYSPFWDDVRTPDITETKADILARTLAAAIAQAEDKLGSDRGQWQWGSVHRYHWRSPASEMRPHLSWLDRLLVGRLAGWLDRGPYPAGGDHNTLNVAGYAVGLGHDVDVVPAMRLVVDFGDPEPVSLVLAGGQSDNPASPHYADGIATWLSGGNRVLPFNDEAARHAHFTDEFVLEPAPPGSRQSPQQQHQEAPQ